VRAAGTMSSSVKMRRDPLQARRTPSTRSWLCEE
jgi:hypothetical protein